MGYTFRQAVADDADACVVLRGQTRENAFSVAQLQAIGVTVETWRADVRAGAMPGIICEHDGVMVGYCFGDRDSGEIIVLALLPAHESKGLGKTLLNAMVDTFKQRGFTRLFLGCSANPAVRSYGFYRHLGWTSTGTLDAANDEVLELRIPS